MTRHDTLPLERDFTEALQGLDTRFLIAAHHGDIDVVEIMRRLLANRGLDGNGRWVGFMEAAQALGL